MTQQTEQAAKPDQKSLSAQDARKKIQQAAANCFEALDNLAQQVRKAKPHE
jgi:hypothetical protein